MSGRTWTFELDDGKHTVEYVKGGLFRELLIKVDGLPLQQMQHFNEGMQIQVIFDIGKHHCLLRCLKNDDEWVWDFYVDGLLIY